jgi:porphobilinogen deaminase
MNLHLLPPTTFQADAYDIAVHSLKDMPTALPDGLVLAGVTEREDVRDAVVLSARLQHRDRRAAAAAASDPSPPAAITSLADLPPGSIIGTSSLRREAFIRQNFPHLIVCSIRGNLQTRFAKLDADEAAPTAAAAATGVDGSVAASTVVTTAASSRAAAWTASPAAPQEQGSTAAGATAEAPATQPPRYDALILAAAGLHRLGWGARVSWYLDPEGGGGGVDASPGVAVGQGALGLECRAGDAQVIRMLQAVSHGRTLAAVTAERAFLRQLQGGCQVPISVFTRISPSPQQQGGSSTEAAAAPPPTNPGCHYTDVAIRGCVTAVDGSRCVEAQAAGVVPVWDTYGSSSSSSTGGSSGGQWEATCEAAAAIGERLAEQCLRGGAERILGPLLPGGAARRPLTYGAAEAKLD